MILLNILQKPVLNTLFVPISASLFLLGCNAKETYDFPPACPKVTVLSSASDAYQFSNNTNDLAHLVTKASILGAEGNCIDDPKNEDNKEKKKRKKAYTDKIDTTMNVVIQVKRGPAAQERRYQIPYFITMIKNGEIMDKQQFVANVQFPDNIDQVTLKSDKILLKIPATADRQPDGYELFIGFQLSPEQLAYNRDHFRPVQYKSY
ncbi:unnamed protein product [Commensalibacter communis]|uniref:hypothetical protein n=1 Tax=Commensalibacter communis TaxID=2972786 RepID=UPI0022FFA084|nr:hypothetical protein [Commensalibacter communis]CAI3925127.1 unnamed protein product [Commensalibacter communis]CAI3934223.1 unnamed protein product [Commensalibacter communis]